MSETPFFVNIGPERVDPDRLRLLLQVSGWTIAGQRTGAYVRLLPPAAGESSVLVPMDRTAPEYTQSMQAALADIRRLATGEVWAANVSARLVVEPSDNFRFRAETAAPSGLIPWTHGEQLISSARRVLAAGAKTHIARLKYYGNRFGQFANRYLDAVLMGQTAPGSYIVTAYTPANGMIPLSANQSNETPLFDLPTDVASTRSAASAEPPVRVSVMGRVHLLTQREAGGPGVIGIENLSTTKPKKLRVHLNDTDYHIALRAHDRNEAVVIEGQMEREGNIHWVYDGRLTSVLGSLDEIAEKLQDRPLPSDPNQLELGSDDFELRSGDEPDAPTGA